MPGDSSDELEGTSVDPVVAQPLREPAPSQSNTGK